MGGKRTEPQESRVNAADRLKTSVTQGCNASFATYPTFPATPWQCKQPEQVHDAPLEGHACIQARPAFTT